MEKKILKILTVLIVCVMSVISASAKEVVTGGDNSAIKLVILTAGISLVLIVALIIFSVLTRKK